MAAAARRPSSIAQTISDWPRCMSPAANTPGTLVIHCSSRQTLPRSVSLTSRSLQQPALLGPDESHRQQHEIGFHLELAAGDRLERDAAVVDDAADPAAAQRANAAVVAAQLGGRDGVDALAALFVRGRGAEDVRPQRPRIVGGALMRRRRHQLELRDRRGALAMHGAEAIGAGVAAADDHHVLAGGVDPRHLVAFAVAVLLRQVVHREMDALRARGRAR